MENPVIPPVPPMEPPRRSGCNPTGKPMLPGSLAALILGISSLAGMAFFGWIPAIIGLVQAGKASAALKLAPDAYSDNSIRMANAGRKMSIAGLILGLLGILVWVLYFSLIFWLVSQTDHYSGYEYY